MKLLVLLSSVPDPPDSGARLRNLGLLQLLAADHEVHALAFGAPEDVQRLAPLVARASVAPPPPSRPVLQRALELGASGEPDLARRLWSPDLLARLRDLLANERYDAVQAEGLEMSAYLRWVGPTPGLGRPWRIYDAYNAEFLLQRRAHDLARAANTPMDQVAALYSRLQWRRLERYEARLIRACRLTLAVSYHDANQLEALAGHGARVEVVPNAIDPARYPYLPPAPDDRPDLLFLGTLDFRPNADALRWLTGQVLPRLWRRAPTARLWVVGRNPPPWLVEIGQHDDRVVVVGPAEDERPYLARAAVLALPLRFGGGSRLKALVGMASGRPILSTAAGMEGLDAVAGQHYVRADDPETFASEAAALLADHARRAKLAAEARSLLERHYTWRAVAPLVRDIYARLAAGR